MAFLPYVKLVLAGTLFGNQNWSCGMSFTNDGTATRSELYTWLGALVTPTQTWLGGTAKTMWSTNTSLKSLSAYAYPAASGHAGSLASTVLTTPTVGTSAQFGNGQLAMVYSLRSGVGGRAGRGRFYLPYSKSDTDTTDGQLTLAHITALATEFKTWADAVNTLSIGSAAAILSIAGRDSGIDEPVVGLTMTSKLYTQRRRIDKIQADATYSVVL